MKIVLLGYMASGKSTIGREISKKLDMKFIDLDDYISKREKRTISEIFKVEGEIYFRRIESLYLGEILNSKDSFILSLGGGTPCYSNNMELILNSEASSTYIKADIKTIIKIGKKKIYKRFNRNIVGLDIKPELPENPDIIIKNDFNTSVEKLSDKLIKSLKKK